MENEKQQPPDLLEAAPAGVDLTLMYRDNGETAWWQVIDVPIRGLLKDGETFKIAAALPTGADTANTTKGSAA